MRWAPVLICLLTPGIGRAQSVNPFQFARAIIWGDEYPVGSGQIMGGDLSACDSRGGLSVVAGRPFPNGLYAHRDFYEDGLLVWSTRSGPHPGLAGSSIGWVEGFSASTTLPALIVAIHGDAVSGLQAGFFTMRDGRIIIRSRQPLVSPVMAGWIHYWLEAPRLQLSKSPDRFYLRSSIRHQATSAIRFGIMEVHHDSSGQVLDERYVVEFGQPLPGQPQVRALNVSIFSVTPDGRLIAKVETDVLGTVLWFDGQVVLAPGDPTNLPGRTIQSIWSCDANAQGDWAAEVRLDGNEPAVVKNGVVQWRGAAPPFDTGGRPIIQLERLSIAEDGRVFVLATNDNSFLQYSRWLVVDGQPVYIPYRDRFEGERVFRPLGVPSRLTDPEGAFITFQAGLVESQRSGTFFVPLVRSRVVCTGPTSSSGGVPTIEYLGSTRTDSEERYLVGRRLPPNATVVWLRSMNQASVPLPGAGQGTVCVGPPIARLAATTDGSGDTVAPRTFFGAAGRHYFQVWYRDHDAGTGFPTSRVSDAVVVDLQ